MNCEIYYVECAIYNVIITRKMAIAIGVVDKTASPLARMAEIMKNDGIKYPNVPEESLAYVRRKWVYSV